MLLEGEEENLGALHRAINTLHRAIQWRVSNFLLFIVTHIHMQIIITLRALRPAISRPQRTQ